MVPQAGGEGAREVAKSRWEAERQKWRRQDWEDNATVIILRKLQPRRGK